jgi:hypothetical protein
LDLIRVETELKKRWAYPYKWGKKQSDDWDQQTNFIYNTYGFKFLLKKCESFEENLKFYAMNRWYNFWSAMAVEYIFSGNLNVKANLNRFDKLVDFEVYNIPFDHKTTVFPKEFAHDLNYAKNHKNELISWLYLNQSQQSRKHFKNRLFILVYDNKGNHWKLKAEIARLKNIIQDYLNNFSKKKMIELNIENSIVCSDIIWFENNAV